MGDLLYIMPITFTIPGPFLLTSLSRIIYGQKYDGI